MESPWYVALVLVAPTNAMGGGGSIPMEGRVKAENADPYLKRYTCNCC